MTGLTSMIIAPLALILIASVVLNVYLHRQLKKVHKTESVELQEFLHDLMAGTALVRISRIAPADIFVRMSK